MLLFLLLVFLPVVPIETEVVRTLADCPGFFVKDTPPVILDILEGGNILDQNRYKVICQTFKDKRRFLTLYDTKNKIPVFSAYRFTGVTETGRPSGSWRTEPQLQDKNMRQLEDSNPNQAIFSDYKNMQDYNKGHLYPSRHAPDTDAKRSTFTLTNVVPQSKSFNCGSWAQMEGCIECLMKKKCISNSRIEAFVVVGAEPGETKLNNKINIPSRMWSAFCCYNSKEDVWLSKAYWGDNQPKAEVTKGSYKEIRANFSMRIFPKSLCSFKSYMDPSKNKYCEKECKLDKEDSTTTAPPPPPKTKHQKDQQLSRKAKNDQQLSRKAKKDQQLSRKAKNDQQLSRKAKKDQQLSRKAKNDQQLSRKAKNDQQLSRKAKKDQQLSRKAKNDQQLSRKAKNDHHSTRNQKTTQTTTSTTKSTPMNQQCSSFSIQENEDRTEIEGEVSSSKNVQNVDSQGCHNLPFFQNSCEK